MFITWEADYAVRCVLHLSQAYGEIVNVNDISDAIGVPKSFLAKIVQKLTRSGIIESVRGARGGFRLISPPSEITLYDVISSIEGAEAFSVCSTGSRPCSRGGTCCVHPVWVRIRADVIATLQEHTFERLLSESPGGQLKETHLRHETVEQEGTA